MYINEKGEITKEIDKQGTDTDYLIYEGQVDPKWTGGFNTTVRYKNLSLNAFFTYQAGTVEADHHMQLLQSDIVYEIIVRPLHER